MRKAHSLISSLPAEVELESYDNIIVGFSGGKDSLVCLLLIYDRLRSLDLLGKVNLEVWHHEVDGREGSTLMDWACTPAYCRAVAAALNVPFYASWLEGGFEREMLRADQPKAKTWFETPSGLRSVGGESKKLSTRLKFPQVSSDLQVRWCSSYLKIDVARIAINNQERFKGARTLVITGERAEESPGRAKYKVFESHECSRGDRHVDRLRLVHGLSSMQIWKAIELCKVNPHPAYRLGFGRCSCQFCIFASDSQWATLWLIDKSRLLRLIRYEAKFGVTIHRTKSLMARIMAGVPYANLKPEDIKAALSSTWDEPIFLECWEAPAGMWNEGIGPT